MNIYYLEIKGNIQNIKDYLIPILHWHNHVTVGRLPYYYQTIIILFLNSFASMPTNLLFRYYSSFPYYIYFSVLHRLLPWVLPGNYISLVITYLLPPLITTLLPSIKGCYYHGYYLVITFRLSWLITYLLPLCYHTVTTLLHLLRGRYYHGYYLVITFRISWLITYLLPLCYHTVDTLLPSH